MSEHLRQWVCATLRNRLISFLFLAVTKRVKQQASQSVNIPQILSFQLHRCERLMLSSILFNCILNIFVCLGIDTNKTDVTLDFSKICNVHVLIFHRPKSLIITAK